MKPKNTIAPVSKKSLIPRPVRCVKRSNASKPNAEPSSRWCSLPWESSQHTLFTDSSSRQPYHSLNNFKKL